jgi:type IV secretory pathway VirB3-like protein
MSVEATLTKRLIGLFLLGYLLLTHPLISLFDRPALVWGIPILYVYIFGVWACVIILAALIILVSSR